MKTLLTFLAVLLCSCVTRPLVVDHPDGRTTVWMGGNLAAKTGAIIAEVTTRNGTHFKFASESEDATDVPIAALAADVTKTGIKATAGVANHAATTDSATTLGLGAQGVQKEGIRAGVSGATKFNPNIPLPIRQ